MSMRDKVEELLRRRAEARRMGGEARLARQKERGKLDARARVDLLVDSGTFVEIGVLATHLDDTIDDAPTMRSATSPGVSRMVTSSSVRP